MEPIAVADGGLTGARAGTGRDLVIVHSLLTDRHAFDGILPELSARFRVTLLNLPGFHGSAGVEGALAALVGGARGAVAAFGICPPALPLGEGLRGGGPPSFPPRRRPCA